MRKLVTNHGLPPAQGLYDPANEHDACGVGFVVNMHGTKSHRIIEQGIEILEHLEHRGACGCDPETGDGAGILIQMPDEFFRASQRAGLRTARRRRIRGRHDSLQSGSGTAEAVRREAGKGLRRRRTSLPGPARRAGRSRHHRSLGPRRRTGHPPGVHRRGKTTAADMFEWKLFVIRKRVGVETSQAGLNANHYFYINSLSSKTIVYKGLLLAPQVFKYYPDLADPRMKTALALVHQRYSTNTFPTWDLAHPFRFIAHNGEINTLKGNFNWMHARESMLADPRYGDDIKKIFPIATPGGSDSKIFDNVLELLVLSGRSLPQAVSMMIPEPWSGHETMSDELRAYYEYQACLMEPWDGPAAMAFTDGVVIGGCLDRNGLRPCRYWEMEDGTVIMASEAGVLEVPQDKVVRKGRLRPGRMFLVDTAQGRIVSDQEIKCNSPVANRTANGWTSSR
ncbi:MAG: hypothetical protein QM811_00870 [Pirellulales bacterium]